MSDKLTAQAMVDGVQAAFPTLQIEAHDYDCGADVVANCIDVVTLFADEPNTGWVDVYDSPLDLPAAIALVETERRALIQALLIDGESIQRRRALYAPPIACYWCGEAVRKNVADGKFYGRNRSTRCKAETPAGRRPAHLPSEEVHAK